ncbi:hypothetical protein [Roseixanthobacter glucoisosaccharinicivorans]|uniref:hypothetical protein n=1 Tax=Roseixanthobacter glucoisosaccharinicivorans TaxID=3119923 RepID=UPI00372CE133
MKSIARILLNGVFSALGALGLTVDMSKAVQAESLGKQSLGDAVRSLPRYPGAERGDQGGVETYLNTPMILTAEQQADSLFGGNRAWRVDKKSANPVTPQATTPGAQGSKKTGTIPSQTTPGSK